MPLLIVLHGAGHDGRLLVKHWQRLAENEGIVVAGPDTIDPKRWQYPLDGPEWLRDVVDDVKKKAAGRISDHAPLKAQDPDLPGRRNKQP